MDAWPLVGRPGMEKAEDVARMAARIDVHSTGNRASKNTLAHGLAMSGQTNMLRAVVEAFPGQEERLAGARNAHGDTPLALACAGGSVGCAALLVKARADVCAVNNDGANAVHAAAGGAHQGCQLCVDMLVRKAPGLAVAKDKRGRTPLHFAAASGRVDILRTLVEAAADDAVRALRTHAKSGRDVLGEARRAGHSECEAFIEEVLAKEPPVDVLLLDEEVRRKPPARPKSTAPRSARATTSATGVSDDNVEEEAEPLTEQSIPQFRALDDGDDDGRFEAVLSRSQARRLRREHKAASSERKHESMPAPPPAPAPPPRPHSPSSAPADGNSLDDDDDDDDDDLAEAAFRLLASDARVSQATERRSAMLSTLEVGLAHVLGVADSADLSPAQADALRQYHSSALVELSEGQAASFGLSAAEWTTEHLLA